MPTKRKSPNYPPFNPDKLCYATPGGYHTILFVNREKQRAVVVLSNSAAREVDTLGSEIMAILDGKKVPAKSFRKSIDVSEAICANLVGIYKLNEAVSFTIATADEKGTALTVQLTGQQPLRIFPQSETRWFLKAVEAEIEFQFDDDHRCVSLVLHQNGLKQTAKKQ
ncbi:MAG: hypothetical protein AAGJ83_08635 [Planctomycetota bacterium]